VNSSVENGRSLKWLCVYRSEVQDRAHSRELLGWKVKLEKLQHQLVKQKELTAKLRRSHSAPVFTYLLSLWYCLSGAVSVLC